MVALEASCVPPAAFTGWPACAFVCQEPARAAAAPNTVAQFALQQPAAAAVTGWRRCRCAPPDLVLGVYGKDHSFLCRTASQAGQQQHEQQQPAAATPGGQGGGWHCSALGTCRPRPSVCVTSCCLRRPGDCTGLDGVEPSDLAPENRWCQALTAKSSKAVCCFYAATIRLGTSECMSPGEEKKQRRNRHPTAPGEPGLGRYARYQLPCDERLVTHGRAIRHPACGCLLFPTCTLLGVRLQSLPGRAEATYFLLAHTPVATKAWLTHRAGGVGQLHQTAAPGRTGLPLKLPQHTAKSCFSGCELPERRNIGGQSWRRPVRSLQRSHDRYILILGVYKHVKNKITWASPSPDNAQADTWQGSSHCLAAWTCCT